jgi:hypothetical protein
VNSSDADETDISPRTGFIGKLSDMQPTDNSSSHDFLTHAESTPWVAEELSQTT